MIKTLLSEDLFVEADLFFAKTLAGGKSEEVFLLLAYLLASARSGHLSIRHDGKTLSPSLSKYIADPTLVRKAEEKILHGFEKIPPNLLEEKGPLCLEKNSLYLRRNYQLEREFLEEISRLMSTPLALQVEGPVLGESLSEEQRLAAKRALISPVSLLSGGPGTGKSFTAVEIIRLFFSVLTEEEGESATIKIAAPTGKAAALLEKSIAEKLKVPGKIECGTIHSFLRKKRFPQTIYSDIFLVDEASMVDADLFVKLLKSLHGGGRLLLMGDKDQLPPVEAGGFFADLIEVAKARKIPATLLTKSRRVKNQKLHSLSLAILSGDKAMVMQQSGVKSIGDKSTFSLQKEVVEAALKAFSFPVDSSFSPEKALKTFSNFSVLSCMKKGPLGSRRLNQLTLEAFLEKERGVKRVALPVLVRANDPGKKLMNGEMGLLVASPASLLSGVFSSEDRAYFTSKEEGEALLELSGAELPLFEPGYCLSVHKSQGSEYEEVLILAPSGSERFGKEILYTAVTRAKEKVSLLVEEKALSKILQQSSRRVSGIVD